MPDKAFVDTTIMTDALLKQSSQSIAAKRALARFAETELPVYAIKEFKAGPLKNYVWFHNKIVTTSKWADAVRAIQAIGKTPMRYKLTTALEALSTFQSSIGRKATSEILARHPNQTVDGMMRDEAKLWLRSKILRAWRKRRSITTRVVSELTCYNEEEIRIDPNGTIDIYPYRCGAKDCCLRLQFINRTKELKILMGVCDAMDARPETVRRKKALRHLSRVPNRPFSEDQCRALGDCVFALQCPQDAVILTTNVRDHVPLASAIERRAEGP